MSMVFHQRGMDYWEIAMKRVRKEDDGTETVFAPLEFKEMGPYRAEIQVRSLDELRRLKRDGLLIAVRMIGEPAGKVVQRNLVPWQEIEDFDWNA